MGIYNVKNSSEESHRYVTAKPLNENIKISPQNSMVMFNLNGTLIRRGVLLRKILKNNCQKAVDKGFDVYSEIERVPLAEYLNHLTQETSHKLEEHIKSAKQKSSDIHSILAIEHIIPIIETSLGHDDGEKFLTEDSSKRVSLKIANYIHDNLVKDRDMKNLIEKALSIYDMQTSVGSQKIIMPEVTNMIENMANLGIPIAIVSNKTQELVNKAFNLILATLSPESQKKYHDKEWHFAKIGVQRDDDGDVIQAIKPAADLLISSHIKADKFNARKEKQSIKNIAFIGQSEAFDMRAADNLQRSNYAFDNGITVYKLLCKYDDPTKKVHDKALINSKSALNHIGEVNQRLSTVFDSQVSTENKNHHLS